LDTDPPVRGFLHRPAAASGDGLVLAHGAGSNCGAPLLVAIAQAFAEAGVTVLRCDLPFRQARPHGPPWPGGAPRDREGLRHAADAVRKIAPGRLFLGGHSYGGRQASMLAAEDPSVASALLLLAYPLHPPNKPTQLRIEHFSKLRMRALFVHGSRDPFASSEELREAVRLIPAGAEIIEVEGAGHDLKRLDPAAVVRLLASGADHRS
jgi:predicted alpha/beta-hydrolase family hydrolase